MGKAEKPNDFVGSNDAKANEVNDNFDVIYNEFNGSIDEYNLNTEKAELKAALAEITGRILYPVGSIYINAQDNTNPATLFGFGSWERFGKGRVMVGQDPDDVDFDAIGEKGGEKTHTLTEGEMPSHDHSDGTLGTDTDGWHNHNIDANGNHNHSGSTSTDGNHNHDYTKHYQYSSGTHGGSYDQYDLRFRTKQTESAGSHSHSISTDGYHNHNLDGAGNHSHDVTGSTANAGSDNAHNNLQPYITVYAWKRTA